MALGLATILTASEQFWGVATVDGVIVLSPDFLHWRRLRDVIAAGAVETVTQAVLGRAVTHPNGSFTWDIPVPDPEKSSSVWG